MMLLQNVYRAPSDQSEGIQEFRIQQRYGIRITFLLVQ